MGIASSKVIFTGILKGAYPVTKYEGSFGLVGPKEVSVTIPHGKKSGDTMTVDVHGKEYEVEIPHNDDGEKLRAGDCFQYKYFKGDTHRVIASTMSTVAGTKVVRQKQVIYAHVSKAFIKVKWNDQKEQIGMARKVPSLVKEAQEELLGKAIEMECNAVLGITTNVTTDSSGSEGNSKLIIITMMGTPCVLVSESTGKPPEVVEDGNVVV